MLTTVNGNDRAGDATRPVAHEKRGESANIVHIDQLMFRGRRRGSRQKFVEAVDSARGSGTDSPGRDCMASNALRAQFGS